MSTELLLPLEENATAALLELLSWCTAYQNRFYHSIQGSGKQLEDAVGLWIRDPQVTDFQPAKICISRHFLPLLLRDMGFKPKVILERWSVDGWLVNSPRGYIQRLLCNGEVWSCYVIPERVWEWNERVMEAEMLAEEKREAERKRKYDEQRLWREKVTPFLHQPERTP